eukprot:753828-Hanusia_phi.AAC.2
MQDLTIRCEAAERKVAELKVIRGKTIFSSVKVFVAGDDQLAGEKAAQRVNSAVCRDAEDVSKSCKGGVLRCLC